MNIKNVVMLATVWCCGIMSVEAQEQAEEFTVATLNVDGLPAELIVSVNPEGPGEKYTPEIADYLLNKNYDIVGFQENFNFYDLLFEKLETTYLHDLCYGKMTLETLTIPFPYDGINLIWKKDISGERTDSVQWEQSYGMIDHANDELTNKGFRRYELTLKGGSQVVVYNGHFDASSEEDEVSGEDTPDRLVRMIQWRQLRDSILNYIDERPIIVMGDMNSYYCRDSIQHQFIEYIEATGKAHVFDAWVELEHNKEYPAMVEGPVTNDPNGHGWVRQGEMVDKILFINPVGGSQLTALSYRVDSVEYVRSDTGTPLGDHFPVAVGFRIKPAGQSSGIHNCPLANELLNAYFDLNGRQYASLPAKKGIYICRGRKILVK